MKHLLFQFSVIFLFSGIWFALSTDTTFAQTNDEPRIHVVQAGENLFAIARKYGITVQNIRDWNNLESDAIPSGTELIVSEPPAEEPETPEPVAPPQEPEDPQPAADPETPDATRTGAKTHTVQAGETLFNISRRFNVSIDQLRRWNNLESNVLSIGQVLIVSEGVQKAEEPQAELSKPEGQEGDALRVERETASYQYYTVRPGDTLSSISRRYSTTVAQLREWNNLRGDVISVGQELIVGRTLGGPSVTGLSVESTAQGRFYTYEFERGDNIFRILSSHQMDEKDFKALNSGLDPEEVRAGMNLVLLAPPTVRHSNPYAQQPTRRPSGSGGNGSNGSIDGAMAVIVYSDSERGQTTTSGELYNPNHLTAAHPSISLGSVVHVKSPDTGVGIFVLVNDRTTGDNIKLSREAYQALGLSGKSEPRVVVSRMSN